MAVVPGPYTNVARSQRLLQEIRQVDSFARIQLIRTGIDLMNTAYNYLDLTPNGGDEGGRGQFWVGAQPVRGLREDSGAIRKLFRARSLSAVSEAPPSEELGVETLCRGASDTALRLHGTNLDRSVRYKDD